MWNTQSIETHLIRAISTIYSDCLLVKQAYGCYKEYSPPNSVKRLKAEDKKIIDKIMENKSNEIKDYNLINVFWWQEYKPSR